MGTRDSMAEGQQRSPVLVKLLAGGGASLFSKTAVAPFERCKLLLQTSRTGTASVSVPTVLGRVVSDQGMSAPWRGNFANCLRVFPTYALRFAFFDAFQEIASFGAPEGAQLPAWRVLLAGALSGAATTTLTYPLDLTRTRLSASMDKRNVGLVQTAARTFELDGLRGMYKGYIISVLEISPYIAVSMGGYNILKGRWLDESSSAWSSLAVGWLSGTCASLICYPLDTVKRRMMVASTSTHQEATIRGCVRLLWQQRGFSGFYAGCVINALNSGPAAAITLVTNDKL